MKKPVILFAIIILFLTGCNKDTENDLSSSDDQVIERSPEEMAKIDEFVMSGLEFPFGITRDSIRALLGKPINEIVTEQKNMHDPSQTDYIYQIYYEGLYFQIYHVSESKKDILLVLSLSSDKYPVHFGLSVNSTREKLLQMLGKPDSKENNVLRYSASEMVFGFADFTFKENRITAIQWTFLIP